MSNYGTDGNMVFVVPTEKENGVSDLITELLEQDAIEAALGLTSSLEGRAAKEINYLRQRVKELEEAMNKYSEDEILLEVVSLREELAALKAGQGEPVAWVETLFESCRQLLRYDGVDTLRVRQAVDSIRDIVHEQLSLQEKGHEITLLYPFPPTIPEGWQLVPIEPLHKLLEYAEESNSARYGTLSTRLVRDLVEEALAAAPNPEDK